MGQPIGSLQTTAGTLEIGTRDVHIDRRPGPYLRGKLRGWRHGGPTTRVAAAFKVVAFLVVPAVLAFQVSQFLDQPGGVRQLLSLCGGLFGFASYLGMHLRPTRIPHESISSVLLDPDTRDIRLRYEPGGPLPPSVGAFVAPWSYPSDPFRDRNFDGIERRLRLPHDADFREAKSLLSSSPLADVAAVRSRNAREVETVFRADVGDRGAVYCPRCGRQVSPSDRACPACDYRLRVPTVAEPT